MGRKLMLILVFFITIITTTYSAYYQCKPSFYYTIPITITDEYYRAIPNAYVSIYHQLSGTIVEEGTPLYVYTPEKKTNEGGKVNITIRNEELTEKRLDCRIKVRVRLYGRTFEKEYDIEEIPKTILFQIPAALLTIEIKDQDMRPLKGKAVVGDEVLEVEGRRAIIVPKGNIEVLVAHRKSKKLYGINVEDDTTLTTIFNYKTITIAAYDQDGKSLNMRIEWENESYEGVGEVRLRIPEGRANIKVSVGNEVRNIDVNTETDTYYKIIIDRKPPVLEGLKVKQEEGVTTVTIKATDEGKFSSGIKKVVMEFNFDDGTYIVRELKEIGGDLYETKIEKEGEFEFKITAYDKEGNKVVASGRHEITYEDTPLSIEDVKEDDLLPIVLGIIFIGLIGGGIYIKKKLQEMEEV